MPSKQPMLGIFWVHRGQVFGRARPLSEGCERWPGLLDSPDDHMTVWEDSSLLAPFPELRGRDYTEVPRGRVIFNTTTATATIYLDDALSGRSVRDRIRAFFHLAATRVVWAGDPHYTTDHTKLDEIFRE